MSADKQTAQPQTKQPTTKTAYIGDTPKRVERAKLYLEHLLDAYKAGAGSLTGNVVNAARVASELTGKYAARGLLIHKGGKQTCNECAQPFKTQSIPDHRGPMVADITTALKAAERRGAIFERRKHNHSPGKVCEHCHFLYCNWAVTGIQLTANLQWLATKTGTKAAGSKGEEINLNPDYVPPFFFDSTTLREQATGLLIPETTPTREREDNKHE